MAATKTGNNTAALLRACRLSLALCVAGAAGTAFAQEATYSVKLLTPEVALKLARATLEACRKEGFQVSVAVADRFGVTQVILRDRFAGPHTVDAATNKAWTAVSFRQDTLGLTKATVDPAQSGLRHFGRVVTVGGGIPVMASGSTLGAVGVSGGPGGEADDRCAKAGLDAIKDDIDF